MLGNCVIALVPKQETSAVQDTFALNDVALRAAAVIANCVSAGAHLGGKIVVGPLEEFEVLVVRTGLFGSRDGGVKGFESV